MMLRTCSLLCLLLACTAKAANILVVFPIPSRSHQILGDEIVKALIKKGHHVTMASPYGMKEESENYTEIVLEGLVEYKESKCYRLISKLKFRFNVYVCLYNGLCISER